MCHEEVVNNGELYAYLPSPVFFNTLSTPLGPIVRRRTLVDSYNLG